MHTIHKSFLRDLETHKKDAELSSIENYHINCWRSFNAINTSINKLKVAEEFVKYSYKFIPPHKEMK